MERNRDGMQAIQVTGKNRYKKGKIGEYGHVREFKVGGGILC